MPNDTPAEAGSMRVDATFGKKGGYCVETFKCDHSVPCAGYGIFTKVSKLAARFRGLPKAEIKAARRRGECITDIVKRPLLAFLGDTTHKVYDWNPTLLDYPVIIGECTFLLPEHVPEVRAPCVAPHTQPAP